MLSSEGDDQASSAVATDGSGRGQLWKVETIAHAIRGCVVARQVWEQVKFSWDQHYRYDERETERFLMNADKLNMDQRQQF
ncbi:hypothetical protein PTKIN_Ptkin10aG0061900 [Pterospermum kingtungense]